MPEKPKQDAPSSTRKWLAVGVALTLSWAVFAWTLKVDDMPPPALETLAVPRPADFGWALLDPDDKPVDFAAFKGRPILLNLWATWCPPCLKEMPSIASLAASDELKGRDILFLCVSTDESGSALRAFLKKKDWPMTVLRATSVPPSFQTEGIPATFLIAPDGRITAAEMGAANWDDPSVIAALQKLAGPAAKGPAR